MRSEGRRLGRALRRIALTALAAPLAAGACRASSGGAGDEPGDAGDADAADEGRPADAAGSEGGDSGATVDGAACAPQVVDGAALDDAPEGCADFHLLPCGLPQGALLAGCFVDLATCAAQCGPAPVFFCQLAPPGCTDAGVVPGAPVVVDCVRCGGASGRRPLGLVPARLPRVDPAGDVFAAMAHLEAASVRAFRDLRGWLAAHGAPARLLRASTRAADDERRHARAAARLARRFGAVPPRARVRRVLVPSLAALLEDDAVEGCVGETYGALLAAWQAARASDPRVRRTMARIADDEARHAALAWAILRWGAPQLEERQRRRVGAALRRAARDLARRDDLPRDARTRRATGLPSPEERRRLLAPLAQLIRDEARGAVMLARPNARSARR